GRPCPRSRISRRTLRTVSQPESDVLLTMVGGRLYQEYGDQVAHALARAAPPCWSPATMRPADTGVSLMRTPNGASAPSMAFAIAAGGEIAPPSPSPFTPSGFRSDGYSRCTGSIRGRSSALGTA